MTSLGIVDLFDSRVQRAAVAAPSSRQASPGASAFADVILDAARVCTDDAGGASAGASTDDASADLTDTPSTPAAPVLPTIIPVPDSAPPIPEIGVGDAAGDVPFVPAPAPLPIGSESTAAPAGVVADPVAAATPLVAAGSTGSPAASATTAASGVAIEDAATVAASPREATAARSPAASTLTATAGAGAAEPSGDPAPADASRIRAGSGPTTGVPTAPGTSTDRLPTAPAAAANDDATADISPEATTSPATPGAASGSTSLPAPSASTATATGDAPTPPPAVGSAPPATPSTPTAPAAVPPTRPALLPQITAPVVSLAQAPDGDHSLTLTVSPENLGPVTVRAHISGGAIHIELHAPSDVGREALRAILVDLRRDLAAAAPHASLLLSTSDDGPASSTPQHSANGGSPNGTAAGSSGQPGTGTPTGRGPNGAPSPQGGTLPTPESTSPASLVSPHGGIEIFA